MPENLTFRSQTLLLALAALAPASAAQAPGHSYVERAARFAPGCAGGGYRSKAASCAPRLVWIPGHFESVEIQRWVPGGTQRKWICARTRRVCTLWGSWREIVVEPGHWVLVPVPGHHEADVQRVWIPGCWTSGIR